MNDAAPTKDDPSLTGYGTGARLFHWVTALLVLVMVVAGITMTSEGFESVRDPLFILHKGLGSVLLVLVLLRLAWRFLAPSPPPLPESVPARQRRLARLTHGALYVLLLVQAGSGYTRVRTGDYPVELLDALGVPSVIPVLPDLSVALSVVHAFSSYALVALVAVHVAAAVHHAWIRRDGVFGRMWPPVR